MAKAIHSVLILTTPSVTPKNKSGKPLAVSRMFIANIPPTHDMGISMKAKTVRRMTVSTYFVACQFSSI